MTLRWPIAGINNFRLIRGYIMESDGCEMEERVIDHYFVGRSNNDMSLAVEVLVLE